MTEPMDETTLAMLEALGQTTRSPSVRLLCKEVRRLQADRDDLLGSARVLAALVREEHGAGMPLSEIAATWRPIFAGPRYTDDDVARLRRVEAALGAEQGAGGG